MNTQPPASAPQQQQQRQSKAATRERDVSAPAALSPAASVAPAETLNQAPSVPPENVAIDPIADASNDASLVFQWKQVKLGSNQSWGFTVNAGSGDSLSGVLEQGTYRKSLQGAGSLAVAVIPPAANGTHGRLVVSNDASGVTARFTWQWQAPEATARVTGGVSKGAGKANTTARSQTQTAATKKTQAQQARQQRGGVQTTFFGQAAIGRRFAFILDKSGSMQGRRWSTCMQELVAALNALSGEAEFFVVLFSSGIFEPPGQRGWTEASADNIAHVVRWVSSLHPDGGTEPAPAFKRVYSLPTKADAIYFLTDGELFGFDAADCKRLRETSSDSGGGFFGSLGRLFSPRRDQDDWDPVINTISLDDNSSATELQKMAEDSGGSYAHMNSSPGAG
jgi:hypothetical protein